MNLPHKQLLFDKYTQEMNEYLRQLAAYKQFLLDNHIRFDVYCKVESKTIAGKNVDLYLVWDTHINLQDDHKTVIHKGRFMWGLLGCEDSAKVKLKKQLKQTMFNLALDESEDFSQQISWSGDLEEVHVHKLRYFMPHMPKLIDAAFAKLEEIQNYDPYARVTRADKYEDEY